jgi:hypothetical protein
MDQYVQTLAHQQEQLHQNHHQIIKQLAALSFNQSIMGEASDSKGVVLPHRPRLPRSSLEATILEAMADRDVDVDEDADVAVARPHLLRAVHPLS